MVLPTKKQKTGLKRFWDVQLSPLRLQIGTSRKQAVKDLHEEPTHLLDMALETHKQGLPSQRTASGAKWTNSPETNLNKRTLYLLRLWALS